MIQEAQPLIMYEVLEKHKLSKDYLERKEK